MKTDSETVKYVNPCVAIMHIGWGISGDFKNDGMPQSIKAWYFFVGVAQRKQPLTIACSTEYQYKRCRFCY